MSIRKLPIGIQSFEDLRNNHYVYVDKTRFIWDLTQTGKVYFLSRPRRFGKSLFLSTLEAYFEGKRELFDGLSIQELEDARGDDAWQAYPVVKFSLSGGSYQMEQGLGDRLAATLENCAQRYGLEGEYRITGQTLPVRFSNLIEQLHAKTGRQVVVLVDEYDKPLLETMIVNEAQEEANRQLYKGFFSVLKDEDAHLKFVFFTGVTKFGKVSIFSDLNQLEDISLSESAAGICGITEEELVSCFKPNIEDVAAASKMNFDDCVAKLKETYDGYRFSPASISVYNPFSLLNSFKQKDFSYYWFSTGTPTFLVNKLMQSDFTPEQLADGVEASESDIMDYRADDPDPIPLFYQSGYLTISGFDREFRIYSLVFPNNEVKYGFLNSLAPAVLGSKEASRPASARNMVLDLRKGNIESFFTRLEALFAGIPYPEGNAPAYESEWRNQIYLVFALLGEHVQCEVHSARGRCDCIVETSGNVYVMEFKLDSDADEALQQIEERGYAEPYKADAREVLKIGVSFSTEKRNIEELKIVR